MVRSRHAPDPRRLAPTVLAAALAVVYLIWQPPSLDLAAAEYRAWLFGHTGLAVWDGQWYGGHHLPGYSVILPPLAWWLGTRLAGALAVVAAAALFEQLVHARYGPRAWLGSTWFAAGVAATLVSGRLAFTLGLVPALGALVALQRSEAAPRDAVLQRRALLTAALVLAFATPLASPVAAIFLALAGTAYALASRRACGIALAAATLVPVGALALAFPEGGVEPFVASAFWPVLAFAVVGLALIPREERTVRIGIVLYALGASAVFLLDTPAGGNVVRLGALCAGPLAALVLWPRRRLAFALVTPFLLWWQWGPAIMDVHTTNGDPSLHAAYYAPLLAFLDRAGANGGAEGRVEIPFTRVHWEAHQVASEPDQLPLARGWQRQLDTEVNPLFYDRRPLTAARYRGWLDRMAVRWVAVPDVPLDYSAQAEAKLIAGGLPYLRAVWSNADWRVYEVRDAVGLVDLPGRVTAVDTDRLTIAVERPATLRLRVRWTPYWDVVAGDACVAPDGEWTQLRVRQAGEVQLATRFALDRIGARSPRCASSPAAGGS
jgi:hypothetical protein